MLLSHRVLVTGYDIIFFWVADQVYSACRQESPAPTPCSSHCNYLRDDRAARCPEPGQHRPQDGRPVQCRRPGASSVITGNSREATCASTPGGARPCATLCQQQDLERQPLPDDEPDHRPVRAARPAGAGGQSGSSPKTPAPSSRGLRRTWSATSWAQWPPPCICQDSYPTGISGLTHALRRTDSSGQLGVLCYVL